MVITHHPSSATLMSFASGSLPEALSAVVATHVAMCRLCGDEVARLERVGALLLADLQPVAMSGPRPNVSLASLRHTPPLLRTTTGAPSAAAAPGPAARRNIATLPPSLARLAGAETLDDIAWRRLGPGLWHKPLALSPAAGGDLRMIRVGSGRTMPEHGHGGTELTLVLEGTYRDDVGCFQWGDVADLDEDTQHQPVADVETGCVCLIASERRARFKGVLARLLQPLTGF